MKNRITDSLHLLQAKEVAKKVPDNMHMIRRIIQYSKLSKDTGDDLDFRTDIPIYVFVAVCCVVVLYLSLLLSGAVLWWVFDDNEEPVTKQTVEQQRLLPSMSSAARSQRAKEDRIRAETARNDILKEIRSKLDL